MVRLMNFRFRPVSKAIVTSHDIALMHVDLSVTAAQAACQAVVYSSFL